MAIRTRIAPTLLLSCLVASVVFPALPVSAQVRPAVARTGVGAAAPAAGEVIRIRKLRGMASQDKARAPSYQTDQTGALRPSREWTHVGVVFDSFPEWLDEITFRYYVLAARKEAGATAYSFYQANVTYVDVAAGRSHESSMFLRPPAVERYGEIVAMAVEIYVGGEIVAQESQQPKDFAQEWKKKTDQPGVKSRPGYLLDRSQTPFALVNYGDYEMVKP